MLKISWSSLDGQPTCLRFEDGATGTFAVEAENPHFALSKRRPGVEDRLCSPGLVNVINCV